MSRYSAVAALASASWRFSTTRWAAVTGPGLPCACSPNEDSPSEPSPATAPPDGACTCVSAVPLVPVPATGPAAGWRCPPDAAFVSVPRIPDHAPMATVATSSSDISAPSRPPHSLFWRTAHRIPPTAVTRIPANSTRCHGFGEVKLTRSSRSCAAGLSVCARRSPTSPASVRITPAGMSAAPRSRAAERDGRRDDGGAPRVSCTDPRYTTGAVLRQPLAPACSSPDREPRGISAVRVHPFRRGTHRDVVLDGERLGVLAVHPHVGVGEVVVRLAGELGHVLHVVRADEVLGVPDHVADLDAVPLHEPDREGVRRR